MAKMRTKDRSLEPESGSSTSALRSPVASSETAKAVLEPADSTPQVEPETKPKSASASPPSIKPVVLPKSPANIPLEVFGQISGFKPDQFAGFAWYAKRERLAPRPVVDWRAAYEKFLSRAVG